MQEGKDKINCRVNDLEFPITHKHHALFETPSLPPSTEDSATNTHFQSTTKRNLKNKIKNQSKNGG